MSLRSFFTADESASDDGAEDADGVRSADVDQHTDRALVYDATAWWPGCNPDGESVVLVCDPSRKPPHFETMYRPEVELPDDATRPRDLWSLEGEILPPRQETTLADVQLRQEYIWTYDVRVEISETNANDYTYHEVSGTRELQIVSPE